MTLTPVEPTLDPAIEPGADLAEELDAPLAGLVRRGLRWSFASNVLSKLSTLLSGIVLAHILDPSDYGHFTVAVVALVLIASVNDLGLEQSIVRWPGSIDRIAPTAATLVFAASCVLYAGCWTAAPYLADSLNDPSATAMVRVLSLGVVINGMFAIPSATLTRSFKQDRRTVADLTGFVVSLGLTVVLAFAGVGAWSLVWGRLVGNAVNSLLHLAFAPARYRPGWSTPVAKELISSGLPIAGTTLLAVAMLNVDYLIVGRELGPIELGLYLMAFNLSSWPVTMFSVAMARVSVAAFGRVQHDADEVRSLFLRYFAGLMAVTVPVCVLLGVLAQPLVRLVYGDEWSGAAAALHFLVIAGAVRVGVQLASDVLVAVGRGRATLALQAIWLAVAVPALAIGARVDGIRGVGIGHAIVAVGLVVPVCLLALRPVGVTPRALGQALARPAAGALAAGLVAWAAVTAIDDSFLAVALGGSLGAALYAATVWLPRLRSGPPLAAAG